MVFDRNVTLRHPLTISQGDGIHIGNYAFVGKGTILISLDGAIDIATKAGVNCFAEAAAPERPLSAERACLPPAFT